MSTVTQAQIEFFIIEYLNKLLNTVITPDTNLDDLLDSLDYEDLMVAIEDYLFNTFNIDLVFEQSFYQAIEGIVSPHVLSTKMIEEIKKI